MPHEPKSHIASGPPAPRRPHHDRCRRRDRGIRSIATSRDRRRMKRIVRSATWRLALALVVGVGIFVLFRQAPALISVVLQSLQDRSKNLLFSSRRSPDGSHLIENIIDPGGPGGPDDSTSRISIRAKNGTENSLEFGTTAPGVFMRWIDETHVELWQEDHRPFLHGV